uniref:Uncharacterized protein n=1 Tax=OCS116 cluster bacterium TaxID=2030921 RepID=A0A2A4Z953_9PROT
MALATNSEFVRVLLLQLFLGKESEAFRLRQARTRVAARRGKRAERTHASANREAKPNVINANFQSFGRSTTQPMLQKDR